MQSSSRSSLQWLWPLVNKFKMIIQYELNQYFMYVGSQYILLEGDLLQSIYSLIAAMYLGL